MNREKIPGESPSKSGKSKKKSGGKSQKGPPKKDKKGKQVQIGKPPRLNPPRLAALELKSIPLNMEVFDLLSSHFQVLAESHF